MKTLIAMAGLALCIAPFAAAAAPAKTATTTYQCSVCHMKFSAAPAKADHYKDLMDSGALVKVAPAKAACSKKTAKSMSSSSSMSGMKM